MINKQLWMIPLTLGTLLICQQEVEAQSCRPTRRSVVGTHMALIQATRRPPPRLRYRPRKNIPTPPYHRGKPIPNSAYRKNAMRIIRGDRQRWPQHAWLVDSFIEKLNGIDDMDQWRSEVARYKEWRRDFKAGY